jgi:hypothetical protein
MFAAPPAKSARVAIEQADQQSFLAGAQCHEFGKLLWLTVDPGVEKTILDI